MSHSDTLVRRVREALADQAAVVEKKMFGGLTFMLRGNMCCGVAGERLVVRVGPDRYEQALARPGVSPMDFTGKPLKGFVYVASDALASQEDLQAWVEEAKHFALSLPAK
ncbi:MAG: RNA methyltransferase [Gemmatimonas sp. SG8_17]|nr:MAG: RNA methyltransferase [Gemmatimonas sp. SG8_17]